ELERADPRRVGLEREDQNVRHEPHVIGDVLRNAVRRTRNVRLREGRPPALQFAFLAGIFDSHLYIANGIEILIELELIAGADLAAEVTGVSEHRVKHAPVTALDIVFEEAVEGEGGVNLQRRGRCGRSPGDM